VRRTLEEAKRRDAERSSRDYWARKVSGRCTERGCPNPASDTATRCDEHRAKFNARQVRRRFVCLVLGVLVAGCGGVVDVASSASSDAGVVDVPDVEVRDAACVEHDGILCQHPKVSRGDR
jgi:hypothetical protein